MRLVKRKMSFTLLKHFRQLNFVQVRKSDLNITNRLCIHCTVVHKQQDDRPRPANLVGPPQTLKSISKEDMISRAMRHYLERKKRADSVMESHRLEYDLGRRHLANIMGLDEEELTQEKIREAIAYLLPSGLHNKKARPLMEHPTYFVPHTKGQEFDLRGRPNHFLYYTLKPKYYELMHNMAWKHERLKKIASPDKKVEDKEVEIGVEWIPYEQFAEMFPDDKVSESDYNNFLVLIDRIFNHPLSHMEKELFEKFQRRIVAFSERSEVEQPKLDENGREYIIARGRRKTARGTVKLTSHGHGHITINGQDITYFQQILHRQAILAPLQLCGVLDKFDVDARIQSKGPTADAGTVRLGIARALQSFVPEEMREELRIAGYLTPDPRMRERKKPGQEKARKKFTWKRR